MKSPISLLSRVAGASQTCCYDFNGWLIFSQDYEYHPDYVKYGSAGTSHRAHPWGGYVFKKPPYVPSCWTLKNNTDVQATVITGVAVQNNDSSFFQFFARKQHRRWRYALDVLVDGAEWHTDDVNKKQSHFVRATLFSPHLNRNQSDLTLLFPSGVGVRVLEMDGHMQVIVALPPEFNETAVVSGCSILIWIFKFCDGVLNDVNTKWPRPLNVYFKLSKVMKWP
uniref:AMOP domain-containing protein n=1 Tax=Romanomermis culicivorax TaxID=13658 RepID=A0A915IVI1_ROMCU